MSHDLCHIDIETFSEVPLKKTGVYPYAESESTDVYIVSWAFDKESPKLWLPQPDVPDHIVNVIREKYNERYPDIHLPVYLGPECPDELLEHAEWEREFVAHNAGFERVILNGPAGQRIGFPHTEIKQWKCTAAKAAAMSLPRSLENVSIALGTRLKDTVGKNDMMALAKLRKGQTIEDRQSWWNQSEKFINTVLYCVDDVWAERDVDWKLPDLKGKEKALYRLDQLINDRGVLVDMPSVEDVQFLILEYRTKLVEKCVEISGIKPGRTGALADWIREQGYDIENLQSDTMRAAIDDHDIPRRVRDVLLIRSLHAMKAVDKYTSMQAAACSDNRLRGMLMFLAAGTGRWSSVLVQLHNLYRPKINDPDTAIKAYAQRDLRWIAEMYDMAPMKVFASTVRGMLIAEDGCELISADYSSIENRLTTWYAEDEEKLDKIRSGVNMYKVAAADIFDMPHEDIKKDTPEYHAGKIAELAFGFQGGHNAYMKMAKSYGVETTINEANGHKIAWREANKKTVRLWYKLDELAKAAIANPGDIYQGPRNLLFKVEGDFLVIRLPSSRKLTYYKPRIEDDGQVTYMGIDTHTRRWMRCHAYGGKWTENIVQATARDILAYAMLRLEEAGYYIILTVHDEVVIETSQGTDEAYGLEDVCRIMCKGHEWTEGLPIEATGWREKRYRK